MANNSTTFGTTVKVDGEKEFKQALESINNGLKVNSSELQKLTAQYASNGSSVEALTKKQDALESKIAGQQEKVETLRKALAAAATDYGESDKRTMAWQVSLNKAEAELFKLNDELSNNQKALEESKATTDGLKYSNDQLTKSVADQQAKIADLKKGLAENAAQYGENDQRTLYFKDALDKAQTELDGMNKDLAYNEKALKSAEAKTDSLGDAVRGLADAVGLDIPPALDGMVTKLEGVNKSAAILIGTLGGVVYALGKVTLSAADSADEIAELAGKTGMSTETIQELNYAADFLETSTETIGSSMAKMTRNMDSARSGTGDAAEAFKALHIRIKDGNGKLKDSETVFYQVIDALGRVRNETEKDALSMAIFGKSAMDLNNLILAGSDGVKEYAKQAHEVGAVMDDETIAKMNELKDATDKMNQQWDAVKLQFAQVLLPIMTDLAEAINGISTDTLKNGIIIAGIILTIGLVVSAILPLINTIMLLSTTATMAGTTIGAAFTAAMAPIAPLLVLIAAVAAAAFIIITHWKDIKKFFSDLFKDVQSSFESFVNWIETGFNTDFTKAFGGVFGDALNGLAANAKNVWDSIKSIFGGGVDFIAGTLTGDWQRALNGLVSIFKGIAQAIATIALAPVNLVISMVNGVFSIVNKLTQLLNKIKIDLPDFLGGGSFGINIPEISKIPYLNVPKYARGTNYHQGGRAIVGEEGPEIVDLPRGSRVYPNGIYPQSGGDTYYITIPAKDIQEFNDIVRIAKNQRRWGVQGVKG